MEILSARPYAFLDDAPLEERRTQAVLSRRWSDADAQAGDLGALDAEAIARVREEAWPQVRDADEMHEGVERAWPASRMPKPPRSPAGPPG